MLKDKMRSFLTGDNRIRKHVFFPVLLAALLLSFWLPTDAMAAPGYDKVANAADTGGTTEVGKYGMMPVYGRDIKDGVYTITGESSSSFFRIEESELTVKDGVMTVAMKVPSTSYKFVYMGTAEEAAAAPLEDYIEPSNKVGMSVYEIPVEALDEGIQCAAYSKRKKKWFDRTILFHASDIPADALSVTLPDYDKIEEALKLYEQTNGTGVTDGTSAANGTAGSTGSQTDGSGTQAGDVSGSEGGSSTQADASSGQNASGQAADGKTQQAAEPVPVDINLDDGTYSIQVNMTGGSGRASVSSPTWLIVKDHKAYAKLLWSSSYYDYMLVGGKKYLNESEDGGNSTFTIPITRMDEAMEVVADTTAMGDPVAIDYRLTFYEDSVGSKSQIPQEAAIDVLILAAIIIVVGGVLNYFVKKRRKH